MTLDFVKLSRVSNATIEFTVAGMFRQKPENVCGNAQVFLIRTKLIKRKYGKNTNFLFFDRCSQRYSVLYSDRLVDAKFDFF